MEKRKLADIYQELAEKAALPELDAKRLEQPRRLVRRRRKDGNYSEYLGLPHRSFNEFCDRFWEFTKQNGMCIEWIGTKLSKTPSRAYGQISYSMRMLLAHKVSFILANKTVPKFELMHKCDNPCCVNPEHLADVPHQVNMMDAELKGRLVHRRNQSKSQPGTSKSLT